MKLKLTLRTLYEVNMNCIRLVPNQFNTNVARNLSSTNESESKSDLVSSPHPVSNLRLIKFGRPANESRTEREFRIKRSQVQTWNQNYWYDNNKAFQKEKKEFINSELKGSDSSKEYKASVSYDELALFYKRFLDANHQKHMQYNLQWYKNHVSLLWPAFNSFLARLKRKILEHKLS